MRSESQTRIVFRVENGTFADFYTGAPLPLKDGTIGDIVLSGEPIPFGLSASLHRKEERVIASKGTRVFIAFSRATAFTKELVPLPSEAALHYSTVPLSAETDLRSDLRLLLRGAKKPKLLEAKVYVHALRREFDSLNQAYTAASLQFEPERKSHAGNVFRHTFVRSEGNILPLENLREREEARFEARTFLMCAGAMTAKEWLHASLAEHPKDHAELVKEFEAALEGVAIPHAKTVLTTLLDEFAEKLENGMWTLGRVTK